MVTKLASFRDSFGKHQAAQGAAPSSGDSTGRMPSYFIFLDQFYYQRSDSLL